MYLRESGKEPLRWIKGLEHLSLNGRQRAGMVQHGEQGGSHQRVQLPEGREGGKTMQPGSFQWRPVTGPESQKGHTEQQKTLLYCESDQAPAQVAQGGCGASILPDTQKLPGCSSGQPALGDPA